MLAESEEVVAWWKGSREEEDRGCYELRQRLGGQEGWDRARMVRVREKDSTRETGSQRLQQQEEAMFCVWSVVFPPAMHAQEPAHLTYVLQPPDDGGPYDLGPVLLLPPPSPPLLGPPLLPPLQVVHPLLLLPLLLPCAGGLFFRS